MLSITLIVNAQTETATSFDGGTGTKDDPFQISMLKHLKLLSDSTKYWRELYYFKLTHNIDAKDTRNWNITEPGDTLGFSPIGNYSVAFNGNFDGNGHYISNLYMNRPEQDRCGFFGQVSNSKINQLILVNCNLTMKGYSGGLIGNLYGGSELTNSYIQGSVRGRGNVFGGLVGNNTGGKITNCVMAANIDGVLNVGGLTGLNYAAIRNCIVTGNVGAGRYKGGIAGQLMKSGSVENVYVSGHVDPSGSTRHVTIGHQETGSSMKQCYYDITKNPVLSAGGEATPLTTEAFSDTSNFSGWDFTTQWAMTVDQYRKEVPRPMPRYNFDYVVAVKSFGYTTPESYQYYNVSYNAQVNDIKPLLDSDEIEFLFWINKYGIHTSYTLNYQGIQRDITETAYYDTKAQQPASWDGNGGAISTLAELRWLSETTDAWDEDWTLKNDINASETVLWNDSLGFSPIGDTAEKAFSGSFNGNGHVIKNLTINRPAQSGIGMFWYVNNTNIRNVGLPNCNIVGDQLVGALVGENYLANISNCYATGKVKGSESVGGLVGANSGKVDGCYAACEVTGENDGVGGLVGWSVKPISNSFAIGSVSGNQDVGGIAGRTSEKMSNCYAATEISANAQKGGLVGRLISKEGEMIYNCYFDTIYANLDTAYYQEDLSSGKDIVGHYSPADFQLEQNFDGWDFSNIWYIDQQSGIDSINRPYLKNSNAHQVIFKIGENGETLVGNTNQLIADGASNVSVEAIPAFKYEFIGWANPEGVIVFNDNPLVIEKITRDFELTAQFKMIEYTVTFKTVGNGYISGNSKQTIYYGSSTALVEALAYDNSLFDGWYSENNELISDNSTISLTNILRDRTVYAKFIAVYDVIFRADKHGSIMGDTLQSISEGDSSAQVTAVANNGYRFLAWQTIDGKNITTNNPLTIDSVGQDSLLIATFEVKTDIQDVACIEFEVYPNPTNGIVQITSTETPIQTIKVVSDNGKLLHQYSIYNNHHQVDLSQFGENMLFIIVQSGSKSRTFKIGVK